MGVERNQEPFLAGDTERTTSSAAAGHSEGRQPWSISQLTSRKATAQLKGQMRATMTQVKLVPMRTAERSWTGTFIVSKTRGAAAHMRGWQHQKQSNTISRS